MSNKIDVKIKSKKVNGLYLDYVDGILGVPIPYMGDNPPMFGKREATKIVNYLNALESLEGWIKHEWKIENT
tara:strand:- start:243 stop:458 length:216 start_codon:yes stop_codon:yes gene_type:complete